MKAVEVILILVSLIISIFRVNSKINILCENVNAFFYQGKNALNLQVEIVLGIISIIILSSLIVLNRIITILFLLNPSLACCFSKVDSVFTFDFFVQYNLVYFDFVRASNSQKSCVWYYSMAKLYQTLVWKSLMGILFNFVLSNTLHTRNTHVLQLSADHQGDCFASCENIISTFIHFRSSQTVLVTFPYLPWYWPWVHVNDNVQPEGVKLSPLCPEKIGFLLLVPGITDSKWD